MRLFNDLGSAIHDAWKKRDFDTRAFPEIAVKAVTEMRPSDHVRPSDVIKWIHTAPQLTTQIQSESTFGDPPICVFYHERFYIEVLFWVDGTTSIHQHAFSGAFHVLDGSSLHSSYEFSPRRRFNDQFVAGDIRLRDVELLSKGDVRPINGNDTIHALFHLDRPSVSVVVRTHRDPFAGPQYAFARPGIAINPFFMPDALKRQHQTLTLLKETDAEDYDEWAYRLLDSSDAHSFYVLLTHIFRHISEERLEALFVRLRPAHTELVDLARLALEERRREINIISKRSKIRQAEHRFFLALLLNLPNRPLIDRMIAARFPGQSPTAKILEWVRELANTPLPTDEKINVLGIELDDSSLLLFECLLNGLAFDAILRRFKDEYSEEDVDAQTADLAKMRDAFLASLLFKPLFAD